MEDKVTSKRTLLVIDYSHDYYELFGRHCTLDSGAEVVVEQTEWKDLHCFHSSPCKVFLKKSENPFPFSSQKTDRIIQPDFLLIRNFPTDIHENHFRNQLMSLLFSGIPSINSLYSLLLCMERPLVHSELTRIKKDHPDSFPDVVPMKFEPNQPIGTSFRMTSEYRESTSKLDFPLVCKIGGTHAGYGKMKCNNQSDLDDLTSCLVLHKDYYTLEPYVPHEYEFRVQRIGEHTRVFKRNSDTCWKGNWGNVQFEDHPMKAEYIQWADLISGRFQETLKDKSQPASPFAGLDIFAIDILHKSNGENVILELNDSACGFMYEHEQEDLQHVKALILKRMNELFPPV